MKKKTKRILIIGSIILVLVIVVGALASGGNSGPEIVTGQVVRGDLKQTVDITGEIESKQEIDLSFESAGTIETVFVEVGDEVEDGALLASLDVGEQSAAVQKAQEVVDAAQARLNLELAGATAEEIIIAEAAVTAAEAAYNAAVVELERVQNDLTDTEELQSNLVTAAELALENAENDLANTIEDQEEDVEQAYDDLVQILKAAMIEVRDGLSEADEVLGIDNTTANNNFENVLAANNSSTLVAAENWYDTATKSRDDIEETVFSFTSDTDDDTVYAAIDDVQEALSDTSQTLLYTRQALDATNIDTADFSSADLEALKTDIDTARDAVQADEEVVLGQQQTITSLEITQASDLISKEYAVSKEESDLTNALLTEIQTNAAAVAAVSSGEASLAIAEADLASSNAQLADTLAPPRSVDLAGIYADIAAAQADLSAAQSRLEKAQIYAPIAGQITRVEFDEGEYIGASLALVTLETDEDQFNIIAQIPESDVGKINLGNSVEITTDAYGDDIVFAGEVQFVEPAEDQIEGVIFYEALITFNENQDLSLLRTGMSVDVVVLTDERSNTLYVQQRAVLERDGWLYVRIPKQKSDYEEIGVETGMRADGGFVEILSGLDEGQEIIVTIRD